MVSLLIWLLAFSAVMIVLMLGAVWGMNKAAYKMVGEKHEALEAIVETGQVPLRWSAPFEGKIAKLGNDPANVGKVARIQERARRHYLKRLESLTHYVESSTLIDGEDTRRELLVKMTRVRTAWQEEESLAAGPR